MLSAPPIDAFLQSKRVELGEMAPPLDVLARYEDRFRELVAICCSEWPDTEPNLEELWEAATTPVEPPLFRRDAQ